MENETRSKVVRAGVILICLSLGLSLAIQLMRLAYPFIVSDNVDDIMEFNTKGQNVLYGCLAVGVAGFALVAAQIKNNAMVIACSAFALVRILNVMGAMQFMGAVPLIAQWITMVTFGCVGLGALCMCEQLREHKRKLLIWCVSLYVATDVLAFWFPTLHITGDFSYGLSMLTQQLWQVLDPVRVVLNSASGVAWIMFWIAVPKLFNTAEGDDNSPLGKLMLNRYSITFLAVEAVAFIIFNIVWKSIEL